MHVYKLCRICLTEGNNTGTMQPLFEVDNERCSEIVQRIELCGGIVLKPHEEFPKMICTPCLEKLNVSYKFRSMCQASEHALLDAIVKSEMKTEPQDYELSKDEGDNDNEIFFDMHTEFIDAQEVHLDDLTETIEEEILESDMEPNNESAEEFIEYTDSEYFEEDPPEESMSKQSIYPIPQVQVKIEPKDNENKGHKGGRPKANKDQLNVKTELNRGKKSNRGRKRKEEPEMANIMCEICGNIYTKRSLLNMHMRRHMAEKPFACEICSKAFACPSEISRHMRVHTGEKPYACKYCGRTFADRSTNIKHERIHTNERPFTCKTCGKSFTYSNVLKNHLLTHTGEKPFPCVPCNKTFSRKHQLDQHIATITHQQTVRNLAAADVKVQQIIHDIQSNQHIATITEQANRGIKIAHIIEEVPTDEHLESTTSTRHEIIRSSEEVDVKMTHVFQQRQHHNADVYITDD
ncbi:transcription factor Ouib-like [Eurosta solidaginis]|uniref:transcription factor Ouib-like n=1 Tax=Eurosta solidaginis TaxID=178769 RepID=UPI0035311C9A